MALALMIVAIRALLVSGARCGALEAQARPRSLSAGGPRGAVAAGGQSACLTASPFRVREVEGRGAERVRCAPMPRSRSVAVAARG